MSEQPAAFKASVHAIRTVGSRKVVQIVLEAPIEHFGLIASICDHDAWIACARLEQQPTKQEPKATNREAQKAGILCADKLFQSYLFSGIHQIERCSELGSKEAQDAAADFIRDYCGVDSRSELTADNSNWNKLQAEYHLWLRS